MNPHRKARLVYRATTLFARLPWPLLRGFARALAWTWVRLDARESRVTRRNLELAYPELDAPARDRLQRELLRSTALQAIETLRLWSRKPADNLRLHLKERHGQALYDAALASGRGVIVAAPHYGNWELLNQWLASRGQIAIVYKPPEDEASDAFLHGWCERIGPDMEFALHIAPTDPAVADPDPHVAATALNAGIERIARRDPAQYQWTYKRYTLRPPGSGEEDPYATDEHPH